MFPVEISDHIVVSHIPLREELMKNDCRQNSMADWSKGDKISQVTRQKKKKASGRCGTRVGESFREKKKSRETEELKKKDGSPD